jgi:hypothetical protein
MDVIRKDATITNTDDEGPGGFQVILSAPTEDRDGETLLPGDWKMPLPDHITFDTDHGMNVASTVGSGVPSLDAEGRLIVDGTYSSLPRAQEVRTLVKEGHIRTTSVAFMKVNAGQKDGKRRTVRELLNGAFVAIPSNRESVVLNSKSITDGITRTGEAIGAEIGELIAKAGARNSKTDKEHIQAIADHAQALGAKLQSDEDTTGAAVETVGGKTLTCPHCQKDFTADAVTKNVEGEPAADESADTAAPAAVPADESAADVEAVQKQAQHIRALALTSIGDI